MMTLDIAINSHIHTYIHTQLTYIHTYIHTYISIPPERNQVHPTCIRDAETIQRIQILLHNYYYWCLGCCPKDTQTQPRKATPTKGENRYHNPEDTETCPNWNFKNMQDCHENVERDFMTVDIGQWNLKTFLYCLRPVYTMISTLDKITTYIHSYTYQTKISCKYKLRV